MKRHDNLVSAVRTALDQLFKPKPKDWTVAVKEALCEACLRCHPNAWLCASGPRNAACREWLYDVTCLLYDKREYVRHIPLVAEVEWSCRRAIYYDFEKLLVSGADVRVMVFKGRYFRGDPDPFEEFSEYIKRLKTTGSGGTYVLAARYKDRFKYRRI